MGWDASGIVEAVGPAVTHFRPGDEVFGNCDARGTGTFAEYASLPEACCAPKPDALSFDEAAVLAVSGCTALQTVRDLGKVGPGMQVLVVGAAGGVGHFAVQIAKASGAVVTGLCSTGKLDFVRSLGADAVIDYTRVALGTDDRKWDVIIDTAGRRPLGELRRVLTPNGVLAIVGGEGGNAWTGGFVERMLAAPLLSLFSKQRFSPVLATVTRADLLELKALVDAAKLRPFVGQRYPLDRAVDALVELEKGHTQGKNVVVI
jgi:NADPH:quinone reductase-like Zn-dependent oxidoreductase